MIVCLAGLPATGKTTLAHALAPRLDALVLDKDPLRQALFGPRHITYTAEQDDLCMELLLQAARFALQWPLTGCVIITGRTFLRRSQLDQVAAFAAACHQPLHVIECVCTAATAHQRLEDDLAAGAHPAGNRDLDLYQRLAAEAEPVPEPKLQINTDQPLQECLTRCLNHLTPAPTPVPTSGKDNHDPVTASAAAARPACRRPG
uniref:AAA family ATPase n=1 Tax=Nonomuraea sp. CA-252377 TaxID=3240003 RepID=UPI003F498966